MASITMGEEGRAGTAGAQPAAGAGAVDARTTSVGSTERSGERIAFRAAPELGPPEEYVEIF